MALEEFLGISNDKLLTSFAETLYMVGIALIIVTIVAFVLAIVLIFTRKGGLYQNVVIYNIINVIINIVRSTPFVVLLVAIMPVTKFLIGTRIGATAAIVPLTVNAIPLLTRLFENSLLLRLFLLRSLDSIHGIVKPSQSLLLSLGHALRNLHY